MNSRAKGKRGEREFFTLMNELLGGEYFKRNLDQTREGGCDGITDLPVAVEVKRQEKLAWPQAIRQAISQCPDPAEGDLRYGKLPVLAWRPSRMPWTVLLIMTPEQFAEYLKERT